MVVCKVQLNGVKELLIGIACESRPAFAIGDPPAPFNHGACSGPNHNRHRIPSCAPPIVSLGGPIPRREGCVWPVGDTFPKRFRPPKG
jgi:hypothetical protein